MVWWEIVKSFEEKQVSEVEGRAAECLGWIVKRTQIGKGEENWSPKKKRNEGGAKKQGGDFGLIFFIKFF